MAPFSGHRRGNAALLRRSECRRIFPGMRRIHLRCSPLRSFRCGPHTSLPREFHFSILFLWHPATFEASFLFLASQKRETKQREKAAAHVRALKNRTGHYPPRNSRAEWKSSFRAISDYLTKNDARSDKPTADATGRFFSRSAGTGRRRHGRGAAPVLDGKCSGGADAGERVTFFSYTTKPDGRTRYMCI